MSKTRSSVIPVLSLFLLAGCHVERIVIEEPVRSQIVEVDTEDHVVVRLDENATTGYQWTVDCANPLVDVVIEHEPGDTSGGLCGAPGRAVVHLRVRRGFNGQETVFLKYARSWSGECAREIKLQLFQRRTNDAGWE